MGMYKLKVFCLSVLLLLLLCGETAIAGVVGSPHDLTGVPASGTDQVCVYCHTPHGADSSANVPLWNKVLNDPANYTQYSSLTTPTFDATEAPIGSVSIACLSCHDGTQAVDVVINAPGSGGYNSAGSQIGSLGPLTNSPVPMLTTDLTDDHPISIPYAAGGPLSTDADGIYAGALGDPDFVPPNKDTVNSNAVWWVDSAAGTPNVREKTDMILYTRTDLNPAGEPFVECGSCHDPHNDETASINQVAFLRVDNAASQVCTACHTK